ncbi:DUF3592 domain-containing protein [Roseiconus lacunae]|uniref:DUF3592 domain-containing protein n=1 Tax=Roseiconus lacunae TaxID=2605694 RepID=UPI00308F2B05|nr:DUF3592 domain-containing protein [Stieleria sp. HD01]
MINLSEAYGERSRSSGTGNSSSTTVYRWNLKYSYTVDQTQYEGTRYDLAHTPSFRSSSFLDLAKEYQTGDSVNVYYDADNPKAALLKTGPTVWSVAWLAVGLVLTGGVLLIAGRVLVDLIRRSSEAA